MLVLFPSKKLKKYLPAGRQGSVTRLCNDFLNSLEEKITAHSGSTYLILFTYEKNSPWG